MRKRITLPEVAVGAVLDCGHLESPHSESTRGYGRDIHNRTLCLACCEALDRKCMDETGKLSAYLSEDGKTITGWPGWVLLNVVREWKTNAGGFAWQTQVTRVWARDSAGNRWYGRGPGRGMYMRLTRSADKRGRG